MARIENPLPRKLSKKLPEKMHQRETPQSPQYVIDRIKTIVFTHYYLWHRIVKDQVYINNIPLHLIADLLQATTHQQALGVFELGEMAW